MADFLDTIGDGLAAIAPTIASAFGGPLAGLAVTKVEEWLGIAPGSAKSDPKDALAKFQAALASPEQIVALKKLDTEFKQFCLDNELQLIKTDNADRDSARQRQVSMRDWTPTALAFLVTAGFFGMLAAMLHWDVPPQNKDMVNIMLGSLGAAWVAVVSFYFGSSAGSAHKDRALMALTQK